MRSEKMLTFAGEGARATLDRSISQRSSGPRRALVLAGDSERTGMTSGSEADSSDLATDCGENACSVNGNELAPAELLPRIATAP
jgi:hypothetical protein